MKKSISFGAPNLIFFVDDAKGGDPLFIDDRNVDVIPRFWSHSSMLIVGTTHRDDGDTNLTVSNDREHAPAVPPRFETTIETPSRSLTFSTSEGETLMEFDVATPNTRVSVWSNDPQFPDNVFILLA